MIGFCKRRIKGKYFDESSARTYPLFYAYFHVGAKQTAIIFLLLLFWHTTCERGKRPASHRDPFQATQGNLVATSVQIAIHMAVAGPHSFDDTREQLMSLTPQEPSLTIALVGPHMVAVADEVFLSPTSKHRVVRCRSGRNAIRLARHNKVHDWYLDTQLPDGSGLDCIEMLQDLDDSARYFLFAEQYHADDEKRSFQFARTRYFALPITSELVQQLLESSPVRASSPVAPSVSIQP